MPIACADQTAESLSATRTVVRVAMLEKRRWPILWAVALTALSVILLIADQRPYAILLGLVVVLGIALYIPALMSSPR